MEEEKLKNPTEDVDAVIIFDGFIIDRDSAVMKPPICAVDQILCLVSSAKVFDDNQTGVACVVDRETVR